MNGSGISRWSEEHDQSALTFHYESIPIFDLQINVGRYAVLAEPVS